MNLYNYFFEKIKEAWEKENPGVDIYQHYSQIMEIVNNTMDRLDNEHTDLFMNLSMPLFFHGTDLRIFNMSNQERIEMHKDCEMVANFLFECYKPFIDSNGFVVELDKYIPKENPKYSEINFGVVDWSIHLNGSPMWQYEDTGIYLTNCPHKAKNYAYNSFAFGEIGYMTYRMMQGIGYVPFTNYNPSPDIESAIQKIKKFAEDESHPVVFVVDNLDYKNAVDLKGNNLSLRTIELIQDIRYTEDIQLSIENAFILENNKRTT
jgi:hypothetical protein